MPRSEGRPAARVGAGIVITRILGFVRERVFAFYFGNGPEADAFRAALKIPNVIRNLLGEGTLSASFIPVYAGMLERDDEDARKLAGVIVSLLLVLTAAAALVGIALAPVITRTVAPGFAGPTRELTIHLVEIMFPMSGVFVLSAWCLGVLNSHRRFFLPYVAPAIWNIAQITTLVALGGVLTGARLAAALAWGALAGGVLQLALQLPTTLKLVGRIYWALSLAIPGVRRVVRAWIPMVFGAGVVQVSSIIDTQLGSLLTAGAVATLGYAQLIALLPISLFGVSVAATALPELSRDAASEATDALRARLADGARRVAFYVIPSAFAFATLSTPIVGALFQTGRFDASDTALVAGVLAAYSIGLPAQASVKLLASGHYAFGDTRTPVRIAVLSVAVSAGLAALLMQHFGPAGIALGSSIAAYLNAGLNVATLTRKTGPIGTKAGQYALAVTLVSSLAAWGAAAATGALVADAAVWLVAAASVGAFGVVYLSVARILGHPDALAILQWKTRLQA